MTGTARQTIPFRVPSATCEARECVFALRPATTTAFRSHGLADGRRWQRRRRRFFVQPQDQVDVGVPDDRRRWTARRRRCRRAQVVGTVAHRSPVLASARRVVLQEQDEARLEPDGPEQIRLVGRYIRVCMCARHGDECPKSVRIRCRDWFSLNSYFVRI